MNQFESNKLLWNNHWSMEPGTSICDSSITQILNGRFTLEAYSVFKKDVSIKDKRILEAGCGTGRFCCLLAKNFPSATILGIDISDNALKIAESMRLSFGFDNISFKKGDLFSIDFPDNYFDVVFNEGVIEHFSLDGNPTYKDALKEMVRVAKPGGKIIVAVPNWYNLIHTFYKWALKVTKKNFEYGYEKSFKHKELVKLYREFDLKNIELDGFYPAHGFYRLQKLSRLFYYPGKILEVFSNDYINRKFGFEIVIKGIK